MSTLASLQKQASNIGSRAAELLLAGAGGRLLQFVFGGAALICLVIAYIMLAGDSAGPARAGQSVIIMAALTVLFALCAVIARPLSRLWRARRTGLTGSRLHNRLVVLFALIAVVPTLFVAIFTAVFLELGLETWFSVEIRDTVDNSVSIAEDYFDEHRKTMQRDMAEVATALNRNAPYLQLDRTAMTKEVEDLAFLHSLSEVIITSSVGEVFARYNFGGVGDANFSRIETLPSRAFEDAQPGVIVPILSEKDNVVRIFMKLDSFLDRYMYASRTINPSVIDKLNMTREHATQFQQLEIERANIQFEFTMIFLAISLVVLLLAILIGLWLANQIVAPISRLVAAADEIGEGNLAVRVAEADNEDEIGVLSRAFNSMTNQLQTQRTELIETNKELDQRSRFTEAVLGGVSVGVIGLNASAEVDLPNKTALSIFEISDAEIAGQYLPDVIPELHNLMKAALANPNQLIEEQVNITRQGAFKSLQVRISSERSGGNTEGFVVTIDDITNLVSAERTAAWADVARRIAHEIKNPLTPIQLSAERLNRKYLNEVSSDPEVFARCTETIIRQVGDIRRMVDEFSGFARMPAPTFAQEDITELTRQTILFLEVSSPNVSFDLECPDEPVELYCDGRLLAQALTNIVKNAVEAITTRKEGANSGNSFKGEVAVSLMTDPRQTTIRVSDNGAGLPVELGERLTEPYVTTRAKGTGLGLAIVRKIMADHGGEVTLENRANESGAVVSLVFSHAQLNNLSQSDQLESSADAPQTLVSVK
jgi:two-component system nitrogen regulation sensor histidine kinase NtrY